MNDITGTAVVPFDRSQTLTLGGAMTAVDAGVETRQIGLVVRPKTQVLLARIGSDLEEARDMVIDSAFMAGEAQAMLGRFGTVIDAMDGERLATTKPLRDATDWVNAGFNEAISHAKAMRDALKVRVLAFHRAEAERAEAARQAEEQRRREAAAVAAQAEAAALARASAVAAEAQKAMDEGSTTVAQALLTDAQVQADQAHEQAQLAAQSLHVPVVAAPSAVKGVSTKYKGRVKNKAEAVREALRRHDANGDDSVLSLIAFTETALNAFANATKGNMGVPGLEAYPVESLRTKKATV